MRELQHLTGHKKSWSKLFARKWLSLRNRHTDFDSDYYIQERRKSCSDGNRCLVAPEDFSDWPGLDYAQDEAAASHTQNLKMFVGTWNVGGKSPPEDLDLRSFLRFPADPADVYFLGFQEIVPLNAGNVLGAEDNSPAAEWLSLIRHTLNTCDESPSPPSFSNSLSPDRDPSNTDDDFETFYKYKLDQEEDLPRGGEFKRHPRYCLAASKQMVGLFLCVWVRSDLVGEVEEMKVSCVGRGIMGYLGNKGSVSISMTLCNKSFCVVCTHLASGEKEGNEVRRNLDVQEILRKTRFGRPLRDGILDHDNVIWLGDLNYRLACDRAETFELPKQKEWQGWLEKDQLRMEQRAGRVFKGWKEGLIKFAPTYKYLPHSDQYVIQSTESREKLRTPAWCDRILWRGNGLKQMVYDRNETRFSDHRPVYSIFSARVHKHGPKFKPVDPTKSATSNISSSTCAARIQAEELFTLTRAQSCIRANSGY